MNPSPLLRRQIRAWLQAGVMDKGQWLPTEEGTPQGGPLSPLLANIAGRLFGRKGTVVSKPP